VTAIVKKGESGPNRLTDEVHRAMCGRMKVV
jgi:hypothetical protein